jgi:hypothetical protein
MGLDSEIVIVDVLRIYAAIVEHRIDRLDHEGRTAQVIFAVLRLGMVTEIVAERHIMDEAGSALPVVSPGWLRKCRDPAEIRVEGR